MKNKLFILFIFCIFSLTEVAKAQKPSTAISVTKFRDSALACTWCQYDSTLVAYNLLQNGYYGIYLASIGPNNTCINERCMSCNNSSLPGKNVAQPTFQPAGKYLLFTAEKATHAGSSSNSIPGIGLYNDLWVMTMDGKKAYQLTNMPDTGISGIIECYFSPNGKEVMWDQLTEPAALAGKQEFGYWVIKIAPFIDDSINGPSIDTTRIKVFEPGNTPAFNEPYGWSPDGSRIIFASDYNQFWVWDDQIYTMDTDGNNIEQMSSTSVNYPYCEHAFYSQNGKYIVWMTDKDATSGSSVGGDDWWIMNADTTDQERLTYFNDTTSSYWTGSKHICCHGCFCSSSTRFIGDVTGPEPVQVNPDSSIGAAYIITFNTKATGVPIYTQSSITCNIYPNPANTIINILLNSNTSDTHYFVFDLLGSKILEGQFNGRAHMLDVSAVADGIYFIKLFDGATELNKKFTVLHK